MAQDQPPPGAMAMSVESSSPSGASDARMGDPIARWLAWLAGLIAVMGLAGWILGVPRVTAMVGVQALVPMTALAIALYSAAIISGTGSRVLPLAGKTLALVALAVATISVIYDLIEIARGAERFDATIVDDPLTAPALWPSPNTALSLMLVGAAIVLEPRGIASRSTRRYTIATAASVALLIAVLTLVGFAYGVDPLRGLPGHLSMAKTTAIAISALSIAVLMQSSGGGLGDLLQGRSAGSVLARVALPATIVLPLILGWIKLIGERAGWFGPTMGTVVRTIAEMVLFAGLAVVAVARLQRLDRDRERLMEDERAARAAAEKAQALIEEHAEALEDQAQQLETTVGELKSTNETLASFFRTPNVMVSLVETDLSPAALAAPEVDYRFLAANAEAAKMLGKSEHEVAGRTAAEVGIPAERRRSFIELLREARRGGKPLIVERPGLSPGSEIPAIQWMSVVVSPLSDQAGRIPRFILIATDVSHQRNLEAELRRAQKLEAVGRLAGGVAHDFNNLLTAITGFTRFALTDLPEDSPVRPDLEQALLAAERAGALTHQLLAFSRQQVLQPQVLNLNEVVANVEPMLRRVIGEDVRIHLAPSDALGSVRADRGQLEQVLVNLVVNARDAMPNGGVLTIETSDVELDPAQAAASQSGAAGPHVMLAVTDTGVGMSATTRDRIFEPFFTTKETGHGTGLGLATVFGIVRQSGGSIWVYSEPGQGSTFKIYLPRYDGPVEVARTPAPVSVPKVSGRVLLVEDDPAVRSIAARVLRSGGYDVVEATTGREGLAVYTSLGGRVDLVLTDLVLPEMGGRAMVASLVADGMTTPVVYMSGYTAEAMSAQSVLEPGDRFVEKPFTPESLLSKVRDALQSGMQERRAG